MNARAALLAAALCAAPFLAGCRAAPVERGPGDGFAERAGLLLRNGIPFTGVAVDTFPGGATRARTPYLRGRKHGEEREYYPSGRPRWTRAYFRGAKDGAHAGWWENGRKMFEYHYRSGVYDGDAREWYPDGKPALAMHYARGVEAGMQRAWRENGVPYANYEARDGRRYGIVNARLCYTVRDGEGVFHAPE